MQRDQVGEFCKNTVSKMEVNNTVCILTAGKGSRMGSLGLKLAKALHPIGSKAIISHIIEKFPPKTFFVIGIGFHGNQIKQYLSIAHEDISFAFVDIDKYEGPESGPGYSLMCCKKHLQKPFYFVSCDTLWKNEVNWSLKDNWLGVDSVTADESVNYCNLKIKNDIVVGISDKKKSDPKDYKAFVGLCHIKDYQIFWESLSSNKIIDNEHQISNGILGLISNSEVYPVDIHWTDVGDEKKYKKVLMKYENYDFSKRDESLYIINNKVIKFFDDAQITARRVKKSKIYQNIFPKIDSYSNQFYSYNFLEGDTLYKKNNIEIFGKLLNWLHNDVWIKKEKNYDVIRKACYKFYKEKTDVRLKLFFKKYLNINQNLPINGIIVPPIASTIEKLPWDDLLNGIPTFIHGDLQFDNIIYNSGKRKFTLLDWRQDFAGNLDFGDLYYDLAKLYGGIILNYDLIKLNLFDYYEDKKQISIDFSQRYQSQSYIKILEKYIVDNGYNLKKIKILVGLIYLNMSPLHHAPFDKLLFHFGRLLVFKELKNNDTN